YVMEYVPGQDGDQLLRERGPRPWPEVLEVAAQVTSALKHAHDHGIIHRDLKPANLLFLTGGGAGKESGGRSQESEEEEGTDEGATEEGEASSSLTPDSRPLTPGQVHVKLTDFSVARVLAGATLSEPGQVLGTAAYLAPEQAAGKPATKRSDLYA